MIEGSLVDRETENEEPERVSYEEAEVLGCLRVFENLIVDLIHDFENPLYELLIL